ncbi:MAG: sulfotransferase [Myxococcota bacterium]|nr:sulfotransferase [Myxococcota bacterium]
MRTPDFFLVGHPRSGSGQLNGYLARHPGVFMAKKELHYFGSDLGYHDPPRSLENYHGFFQDAPDDALRVGEASTWYLFSTRAAQEIHDYKPDAGIVMLLRNPVTLLHSLHSHFVFRGDEDIADFGQALDAESPRKAGSAPMPEHHIPARGLFYSEMLDYAGQVQRYFDVFGRDRVHVVINDDFRQDPQAVVRGVCDYLEIPSDFVGFEKIFETGKRARNSNREPRFRPMQDFLVRKDQQAVLEGVRGSVPGHRFALRAMRRVNIRYTDRAQMDAGVKARVQDQARPHVQALSELLDRDLMHWVS